MGASIDSVAAILRDLDEALTVPEQHARGVCWACGTDHDSEARLNRAVLALLRGRIRAIVTEAKS